MSAKRELFLALSMVWLCLAIAREGLVIVCPDDYSPSPSENYVPLHQLLSTLHLIHSNTTIQLLPAVFKLGPDLSISIANVSNITVGAAGPHRATISCTGSNAGFVFKNVSGLIVQNMNITTFNSNYSKKYSVIIARSTDVTLCNVQFTTTGVYAENVCGSFIIFNALFIEMVNTTALTFVSYKFSCSSELFANISNSRFLNCLSTDRQSCAVYISLQSMSRIYLSDVSVRNNVAYNYVYLISPGMITLERFRLEDNRRYNVSAEDSIGVYVAEMNKSSTNFMITDSLLSNNDINVLQLYHIAKSYIKKTIFFNNSGRAVGAKSTHQQAVNCTMVIYQSTFSNNTITNWNNVVTFVMSSVLLKNCTFSNNTGTSLALYRSMAIFAGTNLFINNHASSGAAILLELSFIVMKENNTTLYLQENVAEQFGGGIYVKSPINFFLQMLYNKTIIVYFDNNVAHLAGNDIYGGHLYAFVYHFPSMLTALHSPTGYKMDVSSSPTRVCECSEQNIHTCVHPTKVIDSIETLPGKKFNLSLMAVGQVVNIDLLSGVPSAVYAYILPQEFTYTLVTGSIPSRMQIQKGLRTCSNLTYSINTTREGELLALSPGGLSQNEIGHDWLRYPNEKQILGSTNDKNLPAFVKVHFLPCPAGFNLSHYYGACVCSNALESFNVECNIDTLMIRRKTPYFWLAINISSKFSGKVLAHRHCPFDYCRHDILDFGLANTDTLCNHNRSGILCGACRSGYSLVLGGTECRQCSNIYLLLLLPFALAGILLVVFLSLTNMTVAAGTINGLLFYANIVTDNKATFFPPGAEDSFLSVFVQWLSLDLGIKSCFFDGLDAYTYTWLQLVFPVYVCLLAFTIIIASRYITWMNKLCGTNIVQVLATLFLLSYTKLQATIASGLSFTAVEVYDEEKLFVWLKDGNVPYLQGKHIALFLVSLLLLCVFSLYTLSIALGPWLQRKTQYKVFCWVLKLKPLFDAYFGPLKNQYRYWTGLLLLSRTVLYLVSSVNVLGDDSVNLLAIAILCLLFTWQSYCVYKHRVLSALDSFFLINLCILSLVSLCNKLSSGGSQTITIYVSSGFAFGVFCATLLYHCFSRLKKIISRIKGLGKKTYVSGSENELFITVDAQCN